MSVPQLRCLAGADGISPGATGWTTLTLPTGHDDLLCNLPGHYAAYMFTELDVTSDAPCGTGVIVALAITQPWRLRCTGDYRVLRVPKRRGNIGMASPRRREDSPHHRCCD